MSRKRLTNEQAYRIKQLYMELDDFGRPRYTQMQLARMFGVGETTVYRAINSQSAYDGLSEPKTEQQLRVEAEQSAVRLAADLGIQLSGAAVEPPQAVDVTLKIEQAIAAERERQAMRDPAKLLEELKSLPKNPLDEE